MRKAKVMPPRKPRGEPAEVTIGNLELQLHNLHMRCSDLVQARDAALSRASGSEMELAVVRRNLANEQQFRSADLMRLTETKAEVMRLEAKLEGYRLHAKDIAGARE